MYADLELVQLFYILLPGVCSLLKLWRTICLMLLFLALFLGTSPETARAAGPVRITIDGVAVETDVPPFIDANNRTIVPVRFVSQMLGCQVGWDSKEQRVSVSRPGITVELYIAQKTATVNGAKIEMDTTAVLRENRTMVPLRFLAETFGLKVGWKQKEQTVTLTSPAPSPAGPGPVSSQQAGTVTGDVVNVRTGPGTEYSRLSQVTAGSVLAVLAENDGWYQVAVPGGGKGWITGEFLDLRDLKDLPVAEGTVPPAYYVTPAGVTRYALVMKDAVNVRSLPTLDSPITAKLALGQQLEILGEQNGWYKVSLPEGQNGWIAGWLVAVKYDAGEAKPDTSENPATGLLSRWVAGERNSAADLPFITAVEVEQSGGGVLLKVSADSPLRIPVPLRLENPSRLVFDFQAYLEGENLTPTLPANHGPVDCFRLGQFAEGVVRVVADLQGPSSYTFVRDAGAETVAIRIQPINPAGKLIAIDPGHGVLQEWGDSDPGAVGPSGLKERDVVQNISWQLGNILLNEGYTVIYTRENNTGLTLEERAAAADFSGAAMLVSVHANASVNRAISGTMTFYHNAWGNAQKNQMLAKFIQSELLARLHRQDKGISEANYLVLRSSPIPAVLVEVAFISNPEEERLLADAAFQQRAAEAIALGIKRYLNAIE